MEARSNKHGSTGTAYIHQIWWLPPFLSLSGSPSWRCALAGCVAVWISFRLRMEPVPFRNASSLVPEYRQSPYTGKTTGPQHVAQVSVQSPPSGQDYALAKSVSLRLVPQSPGTPRLARRTPTSVGRPGVASDQRILSSHSGVRPTPEICSTLQSAHVLSRYSARHDRPSNRGMLQSTHHSLSATLSGNTNRRLGSTLLPLSSTKLQ